MYLNKTDINREEVTAEYTNILKATWICPYKLLSLVALQRTSMNTILSTRQLYKTFLIGTQMKECSEKI